MKWLLMFSLAVTAAYAAEEVKVISNEGMVEHNGKFHYHYELSDGSKASHDGILKNIDGVHEGEAIKGKFAFIADDGHDYVISYTADERGFIPVGEHLPTPPPIPESVLKTLKYLEEHPYYPPEEKRH